MGISQNGSTWPALGAAGFEIQNQGVTRRSPGEGPKVNGGRAQSQEMDSYDQPQYNEAFDNIPGGLSSGKNPDDYDSAALSKGIDVEMEHTDDPAIAVEIAMDHLEEDPEYYDKLEKMEKNEGANEDEIQKSLGVIDKAFGKPDPKNVNRKLPPPVPDKEEGPDSGPLPRYGDPMYWATDESVSLKEFFLYDKKRKL